MGNEEVLRGKGPEFCGKIYQTKKFFTHFDLTVHI